MSRRRPTPSLLLAAALLAPTLGAQAVLLDLPTPSGTSSFGESLASIPDLDGDGFDDLIVSAPGSRRVYAYSGLNGEQLWQRTLTFDDAGQHVVGLGDVDGDGLGDLVATAPRADGGLGDDLGGAIVLSGANGFTISQTVGTEPFAELGRAVAPLGDLDGDGRNDYVLGAPEASGVFEFAGRLVVVSGATGDTIKVLEGPTPRYRLGASLAAVGDLDGDGVGDVVAGAPGRGPAPGAAVALSGRDLSVLRVWEGRGDEELGTAVAGPGDVDGDGVPDVALGAPEAVVDGVTRGEVTVRSGATDAVLFRVAGPEPGDQFGTVLAGPGDLDQDGHADLLAVGASGNHALSGADGNVLFTVEQGLRAGAPAGDIDRDGHPDVIIAPPVWVISGRVPEPVHVHDFGGTSVHGPADFDGDGFDDYVTGHAEANRAWLVSGATGRPMRELSYPTPDTAFFGFAVAVVGDVDGDGLDDVAIGARKADLERGEVFLVSGGTGQTLAVWRGQAIADGFGAHVAAAGDVNGDGVPDVLVGSPREDTVALDAGAAYVYSGATLHPLAVQYGSAPQDQFGASVAGLGDLDGDGFGDWAAGAPRPPIGSNPEEPGLVRVISGRHDETLYSVLGDFDADRFGRSLANVGDVDLDGADDFLVGAPLAAPQGASSGMARLHSGADGAPIYTLFGLAAADRLGRMVGALGDLDGDGVPDFAAGALDAGGKGADCGFVRLYSGVDGAILAMLEGDSSGDNLGRSVWGVGDTDGDGRLDFAVGAPLDDQRTRVHGFDLPTFPWSIMAGGLVGQRGIPRLRGEGPLVPGLPVRLTASGGPAFAAATLHLGRDAAYAPFHGGYLVPSGALPIQGLFADDAGTISQVLPWPAGLPVGVSLYFQYWIEDQAGPEGFSASNAVRATPR